MDKKTSFVLYPADFLAAVHNFKKSQIADLIIALCEKNFYGDVSFKLSDMWDEFHPTFLLYKIDKQRMNLYNISE